MPRRRSRDRVGPGAARLRLSDPPSGGCRRDHGDLPRGGGRAEIRIRAAVLGALTMNGDAGTAERCTRRAHRSTRCSDAGWSRIRRRRSRGSSSGADDPLWLDVVRQHHEAVDGNGYPRGLRGQQIDPRRRRCRSPTAIAAWCRSATGPALAAGGLARDLPARQRSTETDLAAGEGHGRSSAGDGGRARERRDGGRPAAHCNAGAPIVRVPGSGRCTSGGRMAEAVDRRPDPRDPPRRRRTHARVGADPPTGPTIAVTDGPPRRRSRPGQRALTGGVSTARCQAAMSAATVAHVVEQEMVERVRIGLERLVAASRERVEGERAVGLTMRSARPCSSSSGTRMSLA